MKNIVIYTCALKLIVLFLFKNNLRFPVKFYIKTNILIRKTIHHLIILYFWLMVIACYKTFSLINYFNI